MPAANMGQIAAFFDFDKTLLAGDAGVIFGRSLVRYGYEQGRRFTNPFRRYLWYAYVTLTVFTALVREIVFRSLYKLKILKRSTLVKLGYRLLKGMPAGDMHDRIERIWERKLGQRLYPRILEIIHEHKAKGHRVVIVTTGLHDIVRHIHRYVGDDVEVVACSMLQHEGKWTGHVEGPLYGVHKREVVEEFAHANNIDLTRSYAYSDHVSDLAFLASVGHPIAVNPHRALRRAARKRGWEILEVEIDVGEATAKEPLQAPKA